MRRDCIKHLGESLAKTMNRNIKSLKRRYQIAKRARVGEIIICPSCGTQFEKKNYQSAFCKIKGKNRCKDHYWNNVDPNKRNNTTRISPASASWMARQHLDEDYLDSDTLGPLDDYDPGDSEYLDQKDFS